MRMAEEVNKSLCNCNSTLYVSKYFCSSHPVYVMQTCKFATHPASYGNKQMQTTKDYILFRKLLRSFAAFQLPTQEEQRNKLYRWKMLNA